MIGLCVMTLVSVFVHSPGELVPMSRDRRSFIEFASEHTGLVSSEQLERCALFVCPVWDLLLRMAHCFFTFPVSLSTFPACVVVVVWACSGEG